MMGKLACLIGVSGAGKGFVVEKMLRENGGFEIITGDIVLHHAAIRLCPYLKPVHAWDWELWKLLVRDCDVRSAMRRTILDLVGCGSISAPSDKPLLAEATLFGMKSLRVDFQFALQKAGFDISESRVFWLDVSPKLVLEQIRKRDRQNERMIDEAEVDRRVKQYADTDPGADDRSDDGEKVASAIREFFLS